MLTVNFCAGKFREQNIARHNHFLARRRPAAQTERGAPVTFMHHAVGHERIILTMIKQRQVKHLGVLAGAAHEIVILHTMAVVGDGDDAGFFQAADGREFFAGEIFTDGAGDKNIYHAFPSSAFANQRDRASIVNRRCGVGHTDERGEAATRRCRRAAGDIFFGGLAGLAQMNMQVNQTGRNDFAGDIQRRHAGGRRNVFADGGDFASENEHVGNGIKLVGGINHAAAGEKQRIHRAEFNGADAPTQARQK